MKPAQRAPALRVLSGACLVATQLLACASTEDGADEPRPCVHTEPGFATEVVASEFGPGQDFGQREIAERVIGPPQGGGCCAGALDVASLGEGGWVVLGFDVEIVDGEGPDFIVFENAFVPAGAAEDAVYAEVGTVSVSEDGQTWTSFPCTETEYPFGQCAGWRPVFANAADGSIDPFDPAAAGGDAYDLADIGVERARFVRIEDRADVEGTFDLDAVAVVHAECPSLEQP